MPDRRRIVTINPWWDATVNVVKDLSDSTNFFAVRDSFAVKPAKRTTIMAQRQRRYGGSLPTAESHENAAITWQAMVRGTSADQVNAKVEEMLGVLERGNLTDLHFEWRPDGATSSTYYEIRGPATWELTYRPLQYTSTKSVVVNIEIPVAPLAKGDMIIRPLPQGSLPATLTRVPNGSFEFGLSSQEVFGWGAGGTMSSVAFSRHTGWKRNGSYSGLLQGTANAANQYMYVLPDTSRGTMMHVTPGRSYTFSAYVNVITALSNATVFAQTYFYDVFGNFISASPATAISAGSNGAKGQTTTTGTAPGGSVQAYPFLFVQAGATPGTVAVAFDDAEWSSGVFVPGTAPAQVDFQVQMYGTPPAWAMLAWTPKMAEGYANVQGPFGLFPAADTWIYGLSAVLDGNFRADRGARVNYGANFAYARWAFLPSVMTPDDFTRNTVDIEVWGRMEISSTLVSPKVNIYTAADHYFGGRGGAVQYSAEYGTAGKILTTPSSGTVYRMVRLGTVTMPCDAYAQWHYINVDFTWGTGSSGAFGIDYLVCVPAKSRCLSPTGKPLDSSYPRFMPSQNGYTIKVVRSDLSGGLSYGGYVPPIMGADTSMGGSPIEFPPGEVDVFFHMDTQVPDDPTVNTASGYDGMSWFNDLAGPRLYITPRYYLMK